MGLFSKNKDDMPAPPIMPPAPAENSSNLVPPTQGTDNLSAPSFEGTGNLSAPPIPGGNLDDIKSQVEATSNIAAPNDAAMGNLSESIQMPSIEETNLEIPNTNEENKDENLNLDDESLFDFSELDLETTESENKEEVKKETESSPLDDLSFIKKNRKVQEYETFFITTKQFKNLLEIVESVKKKVKDANETHLRLMDIKAEEDIEYENLRKDFEFIEDKLYEVDNLIFEKQ